MATQRRRTAFFVDGQGLKLTRLGLLIALATAMAWSGSWHPVEAQTQADTDGAADTLQQAPMPSTATEPFAS